ncbi:MAG: response regulator [Lachnospiraceae bacterium]|nr:response regulator [Lachnospiraceae bacterium]
MMIGAIIKKRRTAMKLTQEELADKLNVTPQAVSRWENEISLPDITLVSRISEVLNMSCDTLLKTKEERSIHYARVGVTIDTAELLIQNDIDVIFDFQKVEESKDCRRVLHADDSEFLRTVVNQMLSAQGYEVLGAKDGTECMDILSKEKIDILLLDIDMPGYNGFEVLEKVSAEYPDLQVLMLSAMADEKTVQKTKELGAKGFVAKPFAAEDLLAHVRSM